MDLNFIEKIGLAMIVGATTIACLYMYIMFGRASYGILTNLKWILKYESEALIIPILFSMVTGCLLYGVGFFYRKLGNKTEEEK